LSGKIVLQKGEHLRDHTPTLAPSPARRPLRLRRAARGGQHSDAAKACLLRASESAPSVPEVGGGEPSPAAAFLGSRAVTPRVDRLNHVLPRTHPGGGRQRGPAWRA